MLRTLSFSLALSFSLITLVRGAEPEAPVIKVGMAESDQQIVERSRIEAEAQLKAALDAKAKAKEKILAEEKARAAEVEKEFTQRIHAGGGTTGSVTVEEPAKAMDLPKAKANTPRRDKIGAALKAKETSDATDKEARAVRLQEQRNQEIALRNKAWDEQMKRSMSSICKGC